MLRIFAFEKTNINSFINTHKHVLTPATHSNINTEKVKDNEFQHFELKFSLSCTVQFSFSSRAQTGEVSGVTVYIP